MLPFNPDAENRSKKFRAMDNISNGFNGNSPFYNQIPHLKVAYLLQKLSLLLLRLLQFNLPLPVIVPSSIEIIINVINISVHINL